MPQLLRLLLLLLPFQLVAQVTFSGQVLDAASQRPIAGADIGIVHSEYACHSDATGHFKLQLVRGGRYALRVDKKGYQSEEVQMRIHPGCPTVTILLKPKLLGARIWEPWTPGLARSHASIADTILTQRLGNQDLAEIFRYQAGAYVSRQGGGWGDSRLNINGFSQQEIGFTLNGISLDDPETGQFYWSRWSVLRHLDASLDYQSGTGQSLLANNTIGGEVNIQSRGVEAAKERNLTLSRGNNNFQSYRLNWQRGLGWSEWGLTAMLAHDRGNGYVDGTEFQAYSYFLSFEKKLSPKHRLSMSVLGSSQWHDQRGLAGNIDQINLRTFVDPDSPTPNTNLGRRYNHDWGWKDGEKYSAHRDFYSQPLYWLNHRWQAKKKLTFHTLLYGTHGRGGSTGLRGRLRDGASSFGDEFRGFSTGIYDSVGQIRFDDIIAYNQGLPISDFGNPKVPDADGQYLVSRNGLIENTDSGSGFIRRASLNNFDRYGAASTASYQWTKHLKLSAGIDYRHFHSQHFRRVEDLLGADAYYTQGNSNEPPYLIDTTEPIALGTFGTDAQATADNVINYNYSGQIRRLGWLGRAEYQIRQWRFYGQVNRGTQRLIRTDYFNYAPEDSPDNDLDGDEEYFQSPEQMHAYHNYRLGFQLRMGRHQGIQGEIGQLARAPFFDEVFEGNRNRINPEPSTQQARNWFLRYRLLKGAWMFNLQVYQQDWSGRIVQRGLSNYAYAYEGDTLRVSALARFEDVRQLHQGLNLSFSYGLNRAFQLHGSLGLGTWQMPEDQTAIVTDLNNDRLAGKYTVSSAELAIGDAAQTTYRLGANWEIRPDLNLRVDYFYFDRLYAPWGLNQEVPAEIIQLPAYGLLDASLAYDFTFGQQGQLTLFAQANNLLDETYVVEIESNIADDPSTTNVNEFYDNRGVFGLGRTWNAGVKVGF